MWPHIECRNSYEWFHPTIIIQITDKFADKFILLDFHKTTHEIGNDKFNLEVKSVYNNDPASVILHLQSWFRRTKKKNHTGIIATY